MPEDDVKIYIPKIPDTDREEPDSEEVRIYGGGQVKSEC